MWHRFVTYSPRNGWYFKQWERRLKPEQSKGIRTEGRRNPFYASHRHTTHIVVFFLPLQGRQHSLSKLSFVSLFIVFIFLSKIFRSSHANSSEAANVRVVLGRFAFFSLEFQKRMLQNPLSVRGSSSSARSRCWEWQTVMQLRLLDYTCDRCVFPARACGKLKRPPRCDLKWFKIPISRFSFRVSCFVAHAAKMLGNDSGEAGKDTTRLSVVSFIGHATHLPHGARGSIICTRHV